MSAKKSNSTKKTNFQILNMKKKLFIAALALAGGLTLNLKKSFSLQTASVSELINLNKAQASCFSNQTQGGKCSASGNCFANPGGAEDCATAGSPSGF